MAKLSRYPLKVRQKLTFRCYHDPQGLKKRWFLLRHSYCNRRIKVYKLVNLINAWIWAICVFSFLNFQINNGKRYCNLKPIRPSFRILNITNTDFSTRNCKWQPDINPVLFYYYLFTCIYIYIQYFPYGKRFCLKVSLKHFMNAFLEKMAILISYLFIVIHNS